MKRFSTLFASRAMSFLLASLLVLSLTACRRALPAASSAAESFSSGSILAEPEDSGREEPSSNIQGRIPQKRRTDNCSVKAHWPSYAELQAEMRALGKCAPQELHVPLYEMHECMYNTNGMFYIGIDSCLYRPIHNTRPYLKCILDNFPTDAIRLRDADTFYFVYDTDDGMRLFLFFSEKNGDGDYDGIQTPVGFPLLISKMLSHADFAGIQAGDSAEKVRAIDPVISIYEEVILQHYHWGSLDAESKRKENDPVATIHYLRDGLLKIEYDIVDDNRLVVTDLIFDSNYDLTNLYGETYNYRILPQDLPEA